MNPIAKFLKQIRQKYPSNVAATPEIGESRGVGHTESRGVKEDEIASSACGRLAMTSGTVEKCPYCNGKEIAKWGQRKKKYEFSQIYYCHYCKRKFTTPKAKGKSFPLRIILEGLCLYNVGYSADDASGLLKEQFGIEVNPRTLREWVSEYKELCSYARLRPYGMKLYNKHQVIQTAHLFHRQVYDFSVHRAKLALILQEHKHARFDNLREFLEAIQSECPHQFFQEGERSSEAKLDFDTQDVIIREKTNFAVRIANLALQAVNDNKLRHLTLQKFMLCNDSVTVATEVPVYMDKYDIEHMQEALNFRIPIKLDRVLTGHIDILQIRNGAVHILDYKPDASKGKRGSAISQLTLYALMLSRLTGLRVYDFKCAWFDHNSYYEFFPLHVVYKLRDRQKKEDPRQMKFEDLEVKDGDTAAEEVL